MRWLIWTLDPRDYIPRPLGIPSDSFLDAVALHRLSGRLLRKLTLSHTAPNRLITAAWEMHRKTIRNVRHISELATLLSSEYRRQGGVGEVIVLKGPVMHAITGEQLSMRPSRDLDVIATDLDTLVRAATCLGFTPTGKTNHLAEYAILRTPKKDLLEVHSRFDVTVAPRLLQTGTAQPKADRHSARQVFEDFNVSHITYDHLCRNLAPRDLARWAPTGTRIPNLEMAAIIHCAHAYKDYVRLPYPLPMATIRLDEAATFLNLCRHPRFDRGRFSTLIEDHHASDAVNFLRAVLMQLISIDPTPYIPLHVRSPVNLWWDGLDGGLPQDTELNARELVIRSRSIAQFINQLGPTRLDLLGSQTSHPPATVRVLGQKSQGDPAGRYIYRESPGSKMVCTISFDLQGSRLAITLDFSGVAQGMMIGASFYFQDNRYEIFCHANSEVEFADKSPTDSIHANQVQHSCWTRGCHTAIRLVLPSQVWQPEPPSNTASFMLAVREQAEGWGPVQTSAAIPVRLKV